MGIAHLMSNPMASPQLHRPARKSRHRIHRAQLTLQMRIAIPAVLLAPQQPGNQLSKRMPRQLIGRSRRALNGTKRLDAVVDSADASTEPDRIRRGLG